MLGASALAQQVANDRRRVLGALRSRRRSARGRVETGMQPGVDPEVDRDLRDIAILTEASRELRDLAERIGGAVAGSAAGSAARSTSAPAPSCLEVPAWLLPGLPSERYRTVLALRRGGLSWRAIARETGIGCGNSATMARDVVRAAGLWPEVLRAEAGGLGRREIARRLGLPRWAVKAVLSHAPPEVRRSPPEVWSPGAAGDARMARGLPSGFEPWQEPQEERRQEPRQELRHGDGGRENGRTLAGGRSPASESPPRESEWRLLRTVPGRILRVKAEAEGRCQVLFGRDWRRRFRCVALVRRGGASRPALSGLLLVQAAQDVDLGRIFGGLPDVRGWVGRPRPALLSHEESAAWFRGLGWDGVPEARA